MIAVLDPGSALILQNIVASHGTPVQDQLAKPVQELENNLGVGWGREIQYSTLTKKKSMILLHVYGSSCHVSCVMIIPQF